MGNICDCFCVVQKKSLSKISNKADSESEYIDVDKIDFTYPEDWLSKEVVKQLTTASSVDNDLIKALNN